MKIIGLIGGMSWESSLEYYRIINELVKKNLGGFHSAKSLMYSVDFAEIEKMQHQGNWQGATEIMINAAKRVELGGADFIVICTNTMHRMADAVQNNISIPLLHIADATAERIKVSGLKKVGLLGTRFTMEEDFYKERLVKKYAIEVIIPNKEEILNVHNIIYQELCLGIIRQNSRDIYKSIIAGLVAKGAEGIILGCTEITLLINEDDVLVQLFDTTRIHATAAVDYSLSLSPQI
jgi:aspartate racemase